MIVFFANRGLVHVTHIFDTRYATVKRDALDELDKKLLRGEVLADEMFSRFPKMLVGQTGEKTARKRATIEAFITEYESQLEYAERMVKEDTDAEKYNALIPGLRTYVQVLKDELELIKRESRAVEGKAATTAEEAAEEAAEGAETTAKEAAEGAETTATKAETWPEWFGRILWG